MSQAFRIAKKLLYMAVTVFFVLVFNFFLFRLLPGSAVTNAEHASHNTVALANLKDYYGLDQSLWQQFLGYLEKLGRLDLGHAMKAYDGSKDVWHILRGRIGRTLMLLVPAEILAFAVGAVSGVIAAWRRGKAADKTLLMGALTFYAMPTFWLSMLLIFLFCTCPPDPILPSAGIYTPGQPAAAVGGVQYALDVLRHMVLPLSCMALGLAGEYCITMRSTMMDVLTEDYMTTARAKGFTEGYILRRHALPNGLLPMVTLVCMNLGFAIAGAITLETMFSWPGVGLLTYSALENRDYTLLQGIFLLTTVSVVVCNFLADVLYGLIDPRIKNS